MRHRFMMSVLALAAIAAAPTSPPPTRPATTARPRTPAPVPNAITPLSTYVLAEQIEALRLAQSGDSAGALARIGPAFRMLVAYGSPDKDADAFRQLAATRRMLIQLASFSDNTEGRQLRTDLLTYFNDHTDLAYQMAFAIPGSDTAQPAYALLSRLIKSKPADVARLPNLAVAISVVHASPISRDLNENKVTSPDPLELFAFFAGSESKMFFGLKTMPVDLLVYVVDSTASVAELKWAQGKYTGTRDVGALYQTIKYDTDFFERGTPKVVTTKGLTLPNILQYGGVCIDQAYFCAEVGKSIGIPTIIDVAPAAVCGHAWLGFLREDGASGRLVTQWNFEAGRFGVYNDLSGNAVDPVTRKTVPDNHLGLLSETLTTPIVDRQVAAALTDAAGLLGESFTPPPLPSGVPASFPGAPRQGNFAGISDLLEAALKKNAAYIPAWQAISKSASDGLMPDSARRHWADVVAKFCAQKYPHFAYETLEPVVESIQDPATRGAFWKSLYQTYGTRPDIGTRILIHQGEAWEKLNQPTRAGPCYLEAIRQFVKDTPAAVEALARAEALLRRTQADPGPRVLELYRQACVAAPKPEGVIAPEILLGSNWFRLRVAYARRLADANQPDQLGTLFPPEFVTLAQQAMNSR